MKRKLNKIDSLDEQHLLVRDYNNNSLLILKAHMDGYEYTLNSQLNEKYHANVKIDEIMYEALELFSPYDRNVAMSILYSLREVNKPINSSINKIIDTLRTFKDNLSIKLVRGAFGELFALSNLDIRPKISETSIYDFADKDNNDLEIKTFSKIERSINLSYQQLTNNSSALIYSIEVFETSNGKSVKELLESLPYEIQERYGWIKTTNSKLVDEKFSTGELIIKRASDFSEGLSMPKLASDATFKFRI